MCTVNTHAATSPGELLAPTMAERRDGAKLQIAGPSLTVSTACADEEHPIMTATMTALFGGTGPHWTRRQVAVPQPVPGQIVVRAHAVALNNADAAMLEAPSRREPASWQDEPTSPTQNASGGSQPRKSAGGRPPLSPSRARVLLEVLDHPPPGPLGDEPHKHSA